MNLRDWRAKAAVQKVLSAVPGGHRANLLLQRASGGLPISDEALARVVETGRVHIDALRRCGVRPEDATTFEFGAGFDLHMPLIQHALGVRRQTVVDIRRLARPAIVLDTAARLDRAPNLAPADTQSTPQAALSECLRTRGITYLAPCDARATTLASESIDAVITTSTVEHIPVDDLRQIYEECHRVLRPSGVMSMVIDYSDHWSHFDPTITPYNFLRFDEPQWQWWNSALMYQNRLRHSDHLRIASEAGFEVVSVYTEGNDDRGLHALATTPVARAFADRDPSDLSITYAHVTVRRG